MQMNIFGGFSLSDGLVSVNESTLHSNKLNRLLIYILLHRDRDLSHQELIDTFWQEEHSRNPEGALKNLVYPASVGAAGFWYTRADSDTAGRLSVESGGAASDGL